MPATYYDVVLLLIPLLFLGVGGSLTVDGLSTTVAVPVGGLLAMGVIGHALFVRSPTRRVEPQMASTQDGPQAQNLPSSR